MGIPNCVPDYYRELEEEQDRLYAQQMKREFEYQRNKQKLDDADAHGFKILAEMNCHYACFKCYNRSSILTRDEEDDICLFICYANKCNYQKD